MRVLVSGGGSGGHVYPALSVATQLKKEYDAEILYLGSDDGLETELVPAANLPFVAIKAGKLQRYISWKTLTGIARVPLGMAQAVGIVREFRADVAFTSGGYVAVPAGLAARLNGVPLLMHQQDVPPNLSNKLLAPLASAISVAFADSLRYFPARKTLCLGNPIRQEILDARQGVPEQARERLDLHPDLPVVLVTGGSQGARHLNQIVCRALPELLKFCQVLQISGSKLYDETRQLAASTTEGVDEALMPRYKLVAYMSDQMPLALRAASLVVCRSGAATLSELAVLGLPSILVPLPPAIGRSPQEANAATFEQKGAASVINDADLQPELLLERVRAIVEQPERRRDLEEAIRSFARPDATEAIVRTIVSMARGPVKTTPEREVLNI